MHFHKLHFYHALSYIAILPCLHDLMFFTYLHHAPFLVNCTVGEKPPEPESQAEPEPEQQAQAEPEPQQEQQQEEKVKSPEPQQEVTEEKKGLSYRDPQNHYEMSGRRTLVKSALRRVPTSTGKPEKSQKKFHAWKNYGI